MSNVSVACDLESLVRQLGALRDAMKIDDPGYDSIKVRYREASDLLEKAIEKEIDDADDEYKEFARGLKEAVKAIKTAQQNTSKLAEAVKLTAKIIDVAGRVVTRLVAV